jgi:hypothetical protein
MTDKISVQKKIEYYSIKIGDENLVQYIAAASLGALQDLIKASGIPYNLDTLRPITEKEAEKAPYFKHFANDGFQFCCDGTWILGTPQELEKSEYTKIGTSLN